MYRVLLFTVSENRDHETLLNTFKNVAEKFDLVIFTSKMVENNNGDENVQILKTDASQQIRNAQSLAQVWSKLGFGEALTATSLDQAVQTIDMASLPGRQTHVLATGSLHLLGSLFQVFGEEPDFGIASPEEGPEDTLQTKCGAYGHQKHVKNKQTHYQNCPAT